MDEPISHWVTDFKKEFGWIDLGKLACDIDGTAPNYLFLITKIRPIALQQAIESYALASLQSYDKQICIIASSSGKSY